jgi:hypothetical protein
LVIDDNVVVGEVKPMNAAAEERLFSTIKALPPERLAEVEDFVEFLAVKEKRREALRRLLEIAPALEAAGADPITEEEIEREVAAVRAERREQRNQAYAHPA